MATGEDFERFCARVWPQLVGALGHYCAGDVALAEELAQEALIRARRRWPQVSGYDSPVGWCYRVGVNLANDWFRRRRAERRARERAVSGQATAYEGPDTAEQFAVRGALHDLTDRQREAVVLRYYFDLTADEAGAVLGTSAGAIRALTHRAIGTLRDRLDVDVQQTDPSEEVRDGS